MASFGAVILPTTTGGVLASMTFTPWPPVAIGPVFYSQDIDDANTGEQPPPPPTGQIWPRPQGG